MRAGFEWTYLVSAKLEGKSAVIAPPKSGVFVNAIFFLECCNGLMLRGEIEWMCYWYCMMLWWV